MYRGAMLWRGLKSEGQTLEVNAMCDREPVRLLEDRSDVIHGGGSCDDASLRMDLRRRPKRRVLH